MRLVPLCVLLVLMLLHHGGVILAQFLGVCSTRPHHLYSELIAAAVLVGGAHVLLVSLLGFVALVTSCLWVSALVSRAVAAFLDHAPSPAVYPRPESW